MIMVSSTVSKTHHVVLATWSHDLPIQAGEPKYQDSEREDVAIGEIVGGIGTGVAPRKDDRGKLCVSGLMELLGFFDDEPLDRLMLHWNSC